MIKTFGSGHNFQLCLVQMGFKAKNVEIGNIPEWMVENASPSISWERHKELLEDHSKDLQSDIKLISQRSKSEINKLNEDIRILKERLSIFLDKNKNSLDEQELMFLLHFIKEANFKGGQLEHVFQVTLKLQNQYRFLENNKE